MKRLAMSLAGLAAIIIGLAVFHKPTELPLAGNSPESTPLQSSPLQTVSAADSSATLNAVTQPSREAPLNGPVQEQGWTSELKALQQLATRDLESALSEARRLPTKEERDEAILAICFAVARTDPAKATTLAWNDRRGTFENTDDGPALESLAKKWATKDVAAALAWANAQPPDENEQRRDWVFKGIVSVLAQTQPQRAADLVVQQIPPGKVQFQSAILVLDQWKTRDFNHAEAWVAGLPKDGMREALLDYLASFD